MTHIQQFVSLMFPDDSSPEVGRRQRIRRRTFDGLFSFESFWAHFQNGASYNGRNDADKLAHLKASLTGDAGQILGDIGAGRCQKVCGPWRALARAYTGGL